MAVRLVSRPAEPLLLEKPLAATAEDAAAIVDLYRERNLPLTTGQTLRYNQVIRAFKENLSRMGELHSFSANQRLEPFPPWPGTSSRKWLVPVSAFIRRSMCLTRCALSPVRRLCR